MTAVVLAAGGAAWEADVVGDLARAPGFELTRRCLDVAELIAVGRTGVAEIALVAVELPGLDADAVHQLELHGVRVVAVGVPLAQVEPIGISAVVEPGHLNLDDLESASARDDAPDRGMLLAVWGPAGAPGRSTLALSTAASLAARGIRTVLVDADTYGGSLGQQLAVLDDVSGVMAACRAATQGRLAEIADHVLAIDPGLHLLTGLPRADMWPHVRTAGLEIVLRQLRQSYDVVVVDCGFAVEPGEAGPSRSRNQAALHVVAEADEVLVVGRADPVGLTRLVRGLHDLVEVRGHREPLVVVNQMRTSLGWRERDVRATLGRLASVTPVAFLPWDQAGLDHAVMTGRSPRVASPTSPFVVRVESLVTALLARHSVVPSPRPV